MKNIKKIAKNIIESNEKLVWRRLKDNWGKVLGVETEDGKYQIKNVFIGSYGGFRGTTKEKFAWRIFKVHPNGMVTHNNSSFRTLEKAKIEVQERADRYGYENIVV